DRRAVLGDLVAALLDAPAGGERPQALEALAADLELLLDAAAPAAALDGERRGPVAAAGADLGAVVGDGEIAPLDRRRRMAVVAGRRRGDEELALDLDAANGNARAV